MSTISRDIRQKQDSRIAELLLQGLTPQQISRRLGVTTRRVLRVKNSKPQIATA